MSQTTEPQYPEDHIGYIYNNKCVECGHGFQSADMFAQLCLSCLDNLGLHIEEEDNDVY